jgi:hypothetical protein
MAMKKAKPMVAKRRADRKAFVEKTAGMASTPKSKQAARQKFFVQTRIKEMEAKGQTVDAAKRKELRQKFQSGNVSRSGFGAPKKKAASSNSSTSSTPSSVDTSKGKYKMTPPKMTPRTDARGSTGFGKRGMGAQKGYSYTKQSGEKVSYLSGNMNKPGFKPAYSRSQIVRNSDMKPKNKPLYKNK